MDEAAAPGDPRTVAKNVSMQNTVPLFENIFHDSYPPFLESLILKI